MRVKLETRRPAATLQTRDDHSFGTFGYILIKGLIIANETVVGRKTKLGHVYIYVKF